MPSDCVKTDSELNQVLAKIDTAISTLSVNVEKVVQKCRSLSAQEAPGKQPVSPPCPSSCETIDLLEVYFSKIIDESDKLDSLCCRLKM